MATQADLRNKVLQRLGIKQQGQSVPAAYGATISQAYDSLYRSLLARNIAFWPKDAIEDAVLLWLAILVAYHVKDDFGATLTQTQELFALYQGAENNILALKHEPYTHSDEPLVDY